MGVAWEIDKCIHNFCANNLKDWDHLESVDVDESIILKWTLNKKRQCGLDLSGTGYG